MIGSWTDFGSSWVIELVVSFGLISDLCFFRILGHLSLFLFYKILNFKNLKLLQPLWSSNLKIWMNSWISKPKPQKSHNPTTHPDKRPNKRQSRNLWIKKYAYVIVYPVTNKLHIFVMYGKIKTTWNFII